MGVLNVTPDSFSDGGCHGSVAAALHHVERMVAEGADIVDVGGESTRPGAAAVSAAQELDRVIPVVEAIRARFDVWLSVDTSKPAVMRAAVAAGADLLNDVRALREAGALETAAQLHVPVVLMHMQGEPRTMQTQPRYGDVVDEVKEFLTERVAACLEAGVSRRQLIVDVGFGFGKALGHNLSLFKHLGAFADLGLPMLVGVSRKSMIGAVLQRPVEERLVGSVALALLAVWEGAAIVRVHDVGPTVEALRVAQAVRLAE
ncbi:MAG: dihydropteroate synthase [Gammaproteobacteria bacterium SG8_47]|nr:MAG: dihydropteroate synthase [Gammaproteobacteria bacterium SG8_47]